ncbi:MAG: ABC-2 transporter permease [Gemmatimonadota bacterium]|nr:ABC-2 transporter permease [Gemmatimonadota bacterium]MDE2985619.1 ABC-2 transporter permease [Gemmatimonadota bacterium]
MRRDAVLRLFRLHLYRTVKPLWKLGLVTVGVVMIPVFLGGGLNPDMTVGLGAVFLIYLPCSLALNMTQEKIDGSLRFLSSLPITGREHAASRFLATAALSMPLVIWLAALLSLFRLESLPGGPVVTGIGMGAAVFLVSLVAIAFQYKYSGPKARSVFVYVSAAFVAVIWISTLLDGSPAEFLTPAVIATGALVSGIGAAAVGWFAVRTIVEYAPTYDRDKDELTSGVSG